MEHKKSDEKMESRIDIFRGEITTEEKEETEEMSAHYKTISEKLKKWKKEEGQSSARVARIKRVPEVLVETDEARNKYFRPRVLFLGPFHEEKVITPKASKLKQKAAKLFMEIKTEGDVQKWMGVYKEMLRDIDDLMKPYSLEYKDDQSKLSEQSQNLSENSKHAWMLFEDGCAAMYFICATVRPSNSEIKTHEILHARQDLLLLENQLPYDVLVLLMERKFPENHAGRSSIENFIEMQLPTRGPDKDSRSRRVVRENGSRHTHLLQHLRTRLVEATSMKMKKTVNEKPKDEKILRVYNNRSESICIQLLLIPLASVANIILVKFVRGVKRMFLMDYPAPADLPYSCRSAAQLKKKGISFKTSEEKVSFIDGWTSGRLYLPSITIDDLSKVKLLNLVADEMSSDVPNNSEIASYLCFLDWLIDDVADVRILREENIIDNLLGSDEALASLFNEVTTNLVPMSSTYGPVRNAVQSHFNSKRKTWMAQLRNDYFSSPWALIAFCAAISVVSLTLIQTYLTLVPPANTESNQWGRLLHILKHLYMLLILPLPIIILLLVLPLLVFLVFMCANTSR